MQERQQGVVMKQKKITLDNFFKLETRPSQRVIISFPYDSNFSKNKAHGTTRTGKWYTKAEHRRLKEELLELLADACKPYEWKKEKYWIAIHVQKPSNRGDAINYLDAIADVIKHAVGVDDNYMEVENITYEVIKNGTNNKIFISISQ
jgi:hypothetical protein